GLMHLTRATGLLAEARVTAAAVGVVVLNATAGGWLSLKSLPVEPDAKAAPGLCAQWLVLHALIRLMRRVADPMVVLDSLASALAFDPSAKTAAEIEAARTALLLRLAGGAG